MSLWGWEGRMLGRNVAQQCPLWAQPPAGCAATSLLDLLGTAGLRSSCSRAGLEMLTHSRSLVWQPQPGKRSQPEPPTCLLLPGATLTNPQRPEIRALEKLRCLDPLKKHFEGVFRRLCQLRKEIWSCTTSLQFVSNIWMGSAPTTLLCSSPPCLQVWPGFPRGDT